MDWFGESEQTDVLEHFVGQDGEEWMGVDEEEALVLFKINLVFRLKEGGFHSPFPYSYSRSAPKHRSL